MARQKRLTTSTFVHCEAGAGAWVGSLQNVSTDGASFRINGALPDVLKVGLAFRFDMVLPTGPVHGTGEIVWIKTDDAHPELGMRFLGISGKSVTCLSDYCESEF